MNAYNKVDIYIGAWYGLYHYDKSYSLGNASLEGVYCDNLKWLENLLRSQTVLQVT